jgi:hypothetical protein
LTWIEKTLKGGTKGNFLDLIQKRFSRTDFGNGMGVGTGCEKISGMEMEWEYDCGNGMGMGMCYKSYVNLYFTH